MSAPVAAAADARLQGVGVPAGAASSPPVLRLDGVTKRFGPLVAVDGLSLTIGRHEVVGLLGENGAGKSTLLKVLTGVHQPDEGTIAVNGRAVTLRSPGDASAVGIGIVHQEQSLFVDLTVAENIVMGLPAGSTPSTRFGFYRWGAIEREARAVLERIGSHVDPRAKVGALSFAHRQMVEIGRTIEVARLSTEGRGDAVPLVILDEPTSVLERGETEVLEREIAKLRDTGSVIFVSHRLDEVLRICDRVVVMRHGRLVADRSTEGIDEAELFALMIGQSARAEARGAAPAPGAAPALQAVGLTRRGAFRDVSLAVHPGRVTAVVGTVGSGREELCRALFGAEDFDAGTLQVAGSPVRDWSIRRAIRAGVAYLPSERGVEGVVGGLSAARNLALAHPGASRLGPLSLPGARDRMARDWFERLDVRPRDIHLELERFSGGNQQKVALAKWFAAGDPRVLLLDHPLRGLDPGASETVNARIRAACAAGAGVLLLADTLEEAIALGDEILVMRDGEVTGRFDAARDAPTTIDLLARMV